MCVCAFGVSSQKGVSQRTQRHLTQTKKHVQMIQSIIFPERLSQLNICRNFTRSVTSVEIVGISRIMHNSCNPIPKFCDFQFWMNYTFKILPTRSGSLEIFYFLCSSPQFQVNLEHCTWSSHRLSQVKHAMENV